MVLKISYIGSSTSASGLKEVELPPYCYHGFRAVMMLNPFDIFVIIKREAEQSYITGDLMTDFDNTAEKHGIIGFKCSLCGENIPATQNNELITSIKDHLYSAHVVAEIINFCAVKMLEKIILKKLENYES